MNRVLACMIGVTCAVAAISCSDNAPSAPDQAETRGADAPPGVLVSNAVVNTLNATSSNSRAPAAASAAPVAYVSALPGTFLSAVSGSVRNVTRNGAPQTVTIDDGGFDPVAIDGLSGDKLALTLVTMSGVSSVVSMKVPLRQAPQVVRTKPAKGRIDVVLSGQIVVVFSEPVDRSTVASGSVTLRRAGSVVAGKITTSPDGLSAQVVPDVPLDPGTDYVLEIGRTILDLDGDGLVNTSSIDFTTRPVGADATLLFTKLEDRNIYSINADGTGVSQLTKAGSGNYRASWSPDGQRFAFARNYASSANRGFGTGDIFIMNADGSNLVRRTSGAFFWSASWSPDGRKLLLSDEEVYEAHIYIMSADNDGSEPRLLMSDGRSPKWSPDGRTIVYVHTSGDDGYHQIYLMNADGTNEHALTAIDPGGIGGVSWSPDSRRIAFSKCLDDGCNIYAMKADGSEFRTLANVGNAGDLTWSPDGAWIAFSANDYTGSEWRPSVQYIPAAGGPPQVVVRGAFHPSWRP